MNNKECMPPTILMIEQDDDARPLLKYNLRRRGYQAVVALDDEEAIAIVRGRRDRPCLILINQFKLSIDEAMDLGRHIRQTTKLPSHTAIVIMADGYGVEMEGKDVRVGECDYVTYLEDGEQLMNLLYRLCPVQP